MRFPDIDNSFDYYEKRYNITKMATDCGITIKKFNSLSSKDKFITLSDKLRETNKINLASFFYGKLFEVCNDLNALLNKIDCLIKLNEFEEAVSFNNIGWELFSEDPDVNPDEIEEKLSYQKAQILFFLKIHDHCESICEENIIKFKNENFYYLLCANFIASNKTVSAKKLYFKYSNKFSSSMKFLLEVCIFLLDANFLEKAINFANSIIKLNDKQKNIFLNKINKYYSLNKNKKLLEKYFEKELNFQSN